jgi:hypothetical protein
MICYNLSIMATAKTYHVGNQPPQVVWTVVRGDTAAFKVYVADDAKQPLNIADWTILMKFKRPNNYLPENFGVITDDATLILTITPGPLAGDVAGEFTVTLAAEESVLLQTGDIFDVQLSSTQDGQVWTVSQGAMNVIEDVTD